MIKVLFVVLALFGTFLFSYWFHLSGIVTGLVMACVAVVGMMKL